MNNFNLLTLCAAALFVACGKPKEIVLQNGMTLTESVMVKQDTFFIKGADSLGQPVLTIEGDGITVDFQGALLTGAGEETMPDQFSGTGILIKGKNVTLKNARVRGFKVAVMAEGVDGLKLLDCDFSYNYRPHLKSYREREDFSDWLSFHHNEKDEWLRYGAAMYLKNCDHALVKNVTVTGGMNGLMMTNCNDGLFYNNSIHFNSGVGVGLYRSSRNRVMHNKLDWNVRGYSHGFYQRGQDSAGILVYEQSNENTFAYNSATHSGDGFFLWAGQSTMETGEGGCNDNLLYANDFSHAPTNGVEVTFSRNKIVGNRMDDCTYGIWGGYSFESLVLGNHIENCKFGVAIEHGQQNVIVGNEFVNDSTGVQLWARAEQPADWGYAKNRDVSSRDYQIGHNLFRNVKTPLKISASKKIAINDDNQFSGFEKLLSVEKPNEELVFVKNQIVGDKGWGDAEAFKNKNPIVAQAPDYQMPTGEIKKYAVEKLPDGMDTKLPENQLQGRQYILMDEWGPYDFKSPSIWLRNVEGDQYTFLLLGPPTGNWRANDGIGWSKVNQMTGAFPATLICTKKPGAEHLTLDFEFLGEAFTDRFGKHHKKGDGHTFHFSRYEKKLDWKVAWHNYDEANDPLTHLDVFENLKEAKPVKSEVAKGLSYAWWGSPAAGVNEDKFATFAKAEVDLEAGTYRFFITSDDGVKFFVNGEEKLSNWNIHEPATNELTLTLSGHCVFEIQHFDNGGFATLDFRMEPAR